MAYDQAKGKKHLSEEVKLLSIFQPQLDQDSANFVNQMFSSFNAPKSKAPMELDPTQISVWIEYFCRYDEGKREQMSLQLQLAEEMKLRTPSTQQYQRQMDFEIEALLEQLKKNHARITQIRNIGSAAPGTSGPASSQNGDEQDGAKDYIEVAKNDSIVLNAEDLQVIQMAEQKLAYSELDD